jgi:hypothetical protein
VFLRSGKQLTEQYVNTGKTGRPGMMALRMWWVGMAAVVLAACGGGGGGAAAATPSAVAAAPSVSAPAPLPTAPRRSDIQVHATREGTQDSGAVARLAGGGMVAVWTSAAPGGDTQVRLQRFDAQGQPQGVETLVADRSFAPAIAALTGGGFVVTFTTSRSQYETNGHAQLFDAGGGLRGSPMLLAATFFKYVSRPAALPDGGFALAIESITGRFGTDFGAIARYRADGSLVADPVRLNPDLADTRAGVYEPVASGLPDGRAVAAWVQVTPAGRQLMKGTFGAGGAPVGGFQTVSAETHLGSPALATLSGGGHVLAWDSALAAGGRRLLVEVFDANGRSLGRRTAASDSAAALLAPRLAALTGGGFVLAWKAVGSAPGVYERQATAQRHGADGQPQGSADPLGTLRLDLATELNTNDTLALAGVADDGFVALVGRYGLDTGWDIAGALR